MKNEFILAFNEVLEEKQLPKEIILNALESAMVSAYRRSVNASNAQSVEAKIDPDTGRVTVFAEKEIVETVQDHRTEVSLDEALRYDPEAVLGDMIMVESTPKDFGRVAAQTARQVIQQRIRDAEREAQMKHFEKQLGDIISGVVQASNAQGLTIGLEMHAEGTMGRKDMIPGERFRIHDRVRCIIAEVKNSSRGPQIILSRTHRDFLRRLLENEVPEIYHGVVEIRSISREPGQRAKVAVAATQSGIDPVGACVGIRGVRIQAIVRELHDEKIDVIEWSADPAEFIAKAVSPARVLAVYLNEESLTGKTATVIVPEDQLSLAIGRDGQNARLAAKLTNWRIDIKSLSEAGADALYRVQKDPSLAEFAEAEKDTILQIEDFVARKAEGRPLNPEEYDMIAKFIDRIEKRQMKVVEEVKKVDNVALKLKAEIKPEAFEINLLDSNLPEHTANILQEANFETIGDVVYQMKRASDDILALQGIGPRALDKIVALVEEYSIKAEPEAVEEEVAAEISEEIEAVEVETAVSPLDEAEVVPTVETDLPEETFETEPVAEMVEEETPVEPEPVKAQETVQIEEEEEEELPFEELFELQKEIEPLKDYEDDESGDDDFQGDQKTKKAKKKKRKSVQVEYDPEADMIIRRKKHRRSGGNEWDDEWNL
jgi:N utilization substance protein A